MQKNFATVEEMVADEMFLAWFNKESTEKANKWEEWLRQNPAYQPMAAEAVRLLDSLNITEAPVSPDKIEAAYARLETRLEESSDTRTPVVTMRRNKRRWWIGAAAAVLIATAGIFYFNSGSSSKPVLETHYGQVKQQSLPDGSQIMLNANTTVTLGKNWKKTNDREVWLDGEAFFHVKKSAQEKRFIVHTTQLDVIVTGTQFNVSTREGRTSVLLTEGSVTIRTADGHELNMKPGDFITIENNKPALKAMNQEMVLAWKDNKLLFENTPMKEVAAIIRDHYGVGVELYDDPEIAEKKINGMMPNDNLDALLKALEATTDFKITRAGNTIVIGRP